MGLKPRKKPRGSTLPEPAVSERPSGVLQAPRDLAEAIAAHSAAPLAWERLSFSHRREFVQWIEEAKKPETRARRITKAVDILALK